MPGFGADDQRFGGVDGAAATHGEYHVTFAGVLPEMLVSAAQMADVGVGLDVFDNVDQTFAEQALQTVHQAQPSGFREGYEGDALLLGDGGEVLQAAPAEAGIDGVLKTGSHGGSFLLLSCGHILDGGRQRYKSINRRFESAQPIAALR
jgi:hypothetical protein